MNRISISPRNQWQQAVEQLGFGFHTSDLPYWDESVCYQFSAAEVERIEGATATLWQLCLQACERIIAEKRYAQLAIPANMIPLIEQSWEEDHPSIYGRFDLCVRPDGSIKLLEFNADTPTSLFEASIVQWFWLQDFDREKDQFNSIHEKLIAYWRYLRNHLHVGPVHFSCVKESLEDLTNVEYMRDCALQAGLETKLVFVDDIGWNADEHCFVDMGEGQIHNLFKLYPWEWLAKEDFGQFVGRDKPAAFFIEPAWKMLLSNKGILALLWEFFPDHDLLLPCFFEAGKLRDYVKKPLLGREGANVTLVENEALKGYTEGLYGGEGFVFQALHALPDFEGHHPVVGSWVVGQEPAGIGIRESDQLITTNTSRFVPHLIHG